MAAITKAFTNFERLSLRAGLPKEPVHPTVADIEGLLASPCTIFSPSIDSVLNSSRRSILFSLLTLAFQTHQQKLKGCVKTYRQKKPSWFGSMVNKSGIGKEYTTKKITNMWSLERSLAQNGIDFVVFMWHALGVVNMCQEDRRIRASMSENEKAVIEALRLSMKAEERNLINLLILENVAFDMPSPILDIGLIQTESWMLIEQQLEALASELRAFDTLSNKTKVVYAPDSDVTGYDSEYDYENAELEKGGFGTFSWTQISHRV